MIVLIDAGNTRIKFGWIAPDGRRETAILALQHADLACTATWLRQLPAQVTAAVGVNVAGTAIANAIATQLAPYQCPINWVTSQHHTAGIRNAYDAPEQLGADRWVSLVGLARRTRNRALSEAQNHRYTGQHPLMLANFGTATTIDTLIAEPSTKSPSLHSDWVFRGGLIFPGPTLMGSSLARGTANLPEARGTIAAFPTDTVQAISTGIAAAQAGALVRQWLAGLDQCGLAPVVYSTGGAWPIIEHEAQRLLAATQARMGLPAIPITWLAAPVLDGLESIALDNEPLHLAGQRAPQ